MTKAAATPPLKIDADAITVTRRITAAGFVLEIERAGKSVSAAKLSRHPNGSITCLHCNKSGTPPPMLLDASQVDGLIRLLVKVRDEVIPDLVRYGVEGEAEE